MELLTFNTEIYMQNLSIIRNLIPKHTKMCIVLKSDAYGIGIENLLKLNIYQYIDYIAVTENKEAEIIRKYHKNIKIIRIRPATIKEIMDGVKYNIEETIDTFEKFYQIKNNNILSSIYYHLSIDYGMGNLGFKINKDILNEINSINISGIITHFPEIIDINQQQFTQLNKQIINIKSIYNKNKLIFHCCNTENYMQHENLLSYDMIRIGKLQYGIIKNDLNLQSVIQWDCYPVSIRYHKKGDTVSYKKLYTSPKEEKILVLPIGYNKGYPSFENSYSNVIIKNKKYPVVGKITMNMLCVNIGNDNIDLNDKITLFGKSGDHNILLNNIISNNYYDGGLFLINLCRNNNISFI